MPIQEWSDSIWVVQLADEPMLSEELANVKSRAEETEPPPNIVLDMSNVTHANSSNLSQILRIRKLAADRDSKLKVAGVTDPVWVVMLTTGLDKVFDFAENVPMALAGLQIEE